MIFEQALPELLDRYVVTRDLGRKADLIKTVAAVSIPDYARAVGIADLVRLGRTERQARYDLRLMEELEERHGILDRPCVDRGRRGGRHRYYWIIQPDIDRWVGVKWTAARWRIWMDFLGPQCGDDARLVAKMAAHGIDLEAKPAPSEGSRKRRRSTKLEAPTRRDWAPIFPAERDVPVDSGRQLDRNSAPSPISLLSENTPSLDPPRSEREGVIFKGSNDPGERLWVAVRAAVKDEVDIWGTPMDQIRAIGRSNPELVPQLLYFAKSLSWCRTGTGTVKALQAQVDRLTYEPETQTNVDPVAALANVERILASIDPDDTDSLDKWLREKAALEAQIAS